MSHVVSFQESVDRGSSWAPFSRAVIWGLVLGHVWERFLLPSSFLSFLLLKWFSIARTSSSHCIPLVLYLTFMPAIKTTQNVSFRERLMNVAVKLIPTYTQHIIFNSVFWQTMVLPFASLLSLVFLDASSIHTSPFPHLHLSIIRTVFSNLSHFTMHSSVKFSFLSYWKLARENLPSRPSTLQ